MAVTSPAPAASAAAVVVQPVRSDAEKLEFIRFAYDIYAGDPNWVAPLEMERRDFLDPKKNPWFEHGEAQLYLARRGGKIVGRIAAIRDPRYNQFHGTKWGWFGLFECVNDQAIANQLLDQAAEWNRGRGFDRMLGPANFTSNHDWGCLIHGFDTPPAMMMPYNPPYYADLFASYGMTKAKDLFAWELTGHAPIPEKVIRIAEKVRQREGVTVRPIDLKDFDSEVKRVKEVYNAAWVANWGFVPFTDAEFEKLAREMKQVVMPELVLLAEIKGEPVGFAMTLPDANQALKAAGGRLTRFGLPIGLVKLLLASRKINRVRQVTLGIKPGYQRRGLDALLYLDSIRAAKAKGFMHGEAGWTLEDNHLINRAIEMLGGKQSKTFRIFERPL